MKYVFPEVDPITIDKHSYTPEQCLLLAILERAVRDLERNVEPEIRRRTVSWFLLKWKHRPTGYRIKRLHWTFQDICDILEFSTIQIDHLRQKAYEASIEIYQKKDIQSQSESHRAQVKTKREACRAGMDDFSTGTRLSYRQAHAAELR